MNNYILRKSQQEAIDKTIDYFFNSQETHPSFLWNCVMRWGKCLTSLSFIYQYNKKAKLEGKKLIKNVLILSFFPSTEDSWSRLFKGGLEEQENFKDFNFITVNSGKIDKNKVNVFFTSFQEIYTGKDKKKIFYNQGYQLLILDEYHYGSWNGKAKAALKQCSDLEEDCSLLKDKFEKDDRLQYQMKLSLSGTPYKDLIKDEFSNSFRFTYFDEQSDRLSNKNSDYKDCPQLELFSISIQKDNIDWKDKVDFLFKNTNIFNNGKLFIPNKKGASFWLIPSLNESYKIEEYINKYYNKFNFNVINLCCSTKGNTLTWLNNELEKNKNKRNIILSYNKLTLGVTIPEIENVVFLREISTAELYMQAGCRGKSQYSDKSKKKAYLISFDLDNDFSIFQQITEDGVSEEEFLKLLPINFIKYEPEINNSEISPITGRQSFLDALAKIPLHEQIKKSVSSRCLGTNFAISDNLLEALNNISGIGDKYHSSLKRNSLTENEVKEINERKMDPLKAAKKKGFEIGCKDKESNNTNNASNPPHKYDDAVMQSYFEKGYLEGYNYNPADENNKDAVDKNEKDRKESNNIIIYKIQLLIQRFLYILIGDYYRENKFMDIKKAPAEFFAALLGFDDKLFIKLYNDGIIDSNYINNVIISFKSKENSNTPYLGLSNQEDYEFIDLTEFNDTKIEKTTEASIDTIITEFDSLTKIDDMLDEKDKLFTGKDKFIYIAKPSEHLLGLIKCFKILRNYLPLNSPISNRLNEYISYYTALAKGVKIGETHRDPSVRCDELNGYTDKHILFDIFDFVKVDNDKSDIEFHKYLEKHGYKRIYAGTRRELFDITADKALEELNRYITNFDIDSYTELSSNEILKKFKAKEISCADLELILKNKKMD